MKLLVVKMSSLGDVIHALPALTDAVGAIPGLTVDWVVEEAFAAIPAMHPGVDDVLPIAWRRWRAAPWRYRAEMGAFRRVLRAQSYDMVLDAQGLVKSAVIVLGARGFEKVGFDRASAREPLAALACDRGVAVNKDQHAVRRLRQLFAAALGYRIPGDRIDYGLAGPAADAGSRDVLLLHGTTWPSKHWPHSFWMELAALVRESGYRPVITAGNAAERSRAQQIAEGGDACVLDQLPLDELLGRFRGCQAAITVDTGLGHLAAAAAVPLVAIFGPTNPGLTGPLSERQAVLAGDHLPCIPCLRRDCRFAQGAEVWPPCYARITPALVWDRAQALMAADNRR